MILLLIHWIKSRVGEYLRYSSERYRRYRGCQYLIFILDTLFKSQYLNGIFRYLVMQKIRYFYLSQSQRKQLLRQLKIT